MIDICMYIYIHMRARTYTGLKVMIPSGSPQTSQTLVSKHHCTGRKITSSGAREMPGELRTSCAKE